MQTKRLMTESPLRLEEIALATARQSLPPYSSKFTHKDFTQHQLITLTKKGNTSFHDYEDEFDSPGKEPNRLDKHQRLVFVYGEIDTEWPDRGAANLQAQGRQAIERFAEFVWIAAESIDNRAQRMQELFASPLERRTPL